MESDPLETLQGDHHHGFLVQNGVHLNHQHAGGCAKAAQIFPLSDIEMIDFQSESYTSLKDLMPASPPAMMSPPTSRKDSWREIPLKDPLMKHAAWAYLRPAMSALEADDHRGFVVELKDRICGLLGCFQAVILVVVKSLLWTEEREYEEENNDEDEDGDKIE